MHFTVQTVAIPLLEGKLNKNGLRKHSARKSSWSKIISCGMQPFPQMIIFMVSEFFSSNRMQIDSFVAQKVERDF